MTEPNVKKNMINETNIEETTSKKTAVEPKNKQTADALFDCPACREQISDSICQAIACGAEPVENALDERSAPLAEAVAEHRELCLHCEKNPIVMDNARLNQAIIFATQRHAGQLRKGTTLPYILHPLETMQILSQMQADMNLQIAGLLHDTIEDTDTTAEELAALFGEDVARLVNHHSEDKGLVWLKRKTLALQALQTADFRLKMLVLADKLSNLRSIARDYQALGDHLWSRFNAPKEKQAWYYNGILSALSDLQQYEETAAAYWELTEHYKDVFVIYKITPTYDKLYQANTFGEAYCLTKGNPQWEPVNYRFRQNDISLTRKEAESLEDKWYDLFLNAVEYDLQDGVYPLFTTPNKTFSLALHQTRLTFSVTGTEPQSVTLDEDDTYQFLSQLRMACGIQAPLAQILLQTFGNENGAALFQELCAQLTTEC